MREFLIKILFRLLKIPIASKPIDHAKWKEWIGLQYPLPQFRDYIATQNFYLLQILGEGIYHNIEYWINVGRRIELGRLLTEGKNSFKELEKNRRVKQAEAQRKQNENPENQKS